MLTDAQVEAMAERLRGLLDLEMDSNEFGYVLIFVERERYQKDKEPTPIVVANLPENVTVNLIKLTGKAL